VTQVGWNPPGDARRYGRERNFCGQREPHADVTDALPTRVREAITPAPLGGSWVSTAQPQNSQCGTPV